MKEEQPTILLYGTVTVAHVIHHINTSKHIRLNEGIDGPIV
jgi:hypothetical protein